MAEKLESYEFRDERSSKYDRFLDGGVWRLRLGEDVPPKVSSARSAVERRAAANGLKLRVSAVEKGVIVVQAYTPENAR